MLWLRIVPNSTLGLGYQRLAFKILVSHMGGVRVVAFQLAHFIYLGNNNTYCMFTMCCTICVLFPIKTVYFIILSFLVRAIFTFYVKGALKFKRLPLLGININLGVMETGCEDVSLTDLAWDRV